MIFKGKFDRVIPPIGIFDRLIMQSGAPVNQRVIFMIDDKEVVMLRGVAPGTDLEIDAPALGTPSEGIKSNTVRIV
jgi:hypothetical protein